MKLLPFTIVFLPDIDNFVFIIYPGKRRVKIVFSEDVKPKMLMYMYEVFIEIILY